MITRTPLLAGWLLIGASAFPHAAIADAAPDTRLTSLADLVSECDSCHGPGGVSPRADVPSLAGQDADELMSAIERFHTYERHCPDSRPRHGDANRPILNMCEISGGMTEAQARALADHYAALPPGS